MKVTTLRNNIYSILDGVIESGKPVEIERKGHILKILSVDPLGKISKLKKRKTSIIEGNSNDLPNIHWEKEWKSEFI